MSFHSPYAFFCCQHGAEPICKASQCEPEGPYRLSFSQPGFVTLKSELPMAPWSRAVPSGPFIRARGHALQRLESDDAQNLVSQFMELYTALDWEYLHVWQRDQNVPGWNGFEPGTNALTQAMVDLVRIALETAGDPRSARLNQIAPRDAKVIDIIIVEPRHWWIGAHRVETIEDGWPGGVWPIRPPEMMISRAYLKIAEAMAWGQLFPGPGDSVVEIGSSPGGACQWLLDLGCRVTGVDPAEMAPEIMAHPQFTHWRSKSLQVKRKLFKQFRYLVCDANVAPNYTLDTVESIVTYPTNQLEALVLTMKLSEWSSASEIPKHLERVKSWGYSQVQARQLAFNRREYCLIAKR